MGHGTSKGQIDAIFEKRIKDLEASARATADSFKKAYKDEFKKWATPDSVSNLFHVPSLHMTTWDRFAINAKYSADILNGDPKTGGTVADLIAMKLQNDFLAAEERAFRLRHASYARCGALMHGRFDGHGIEGDSAFSFVKKSIQKIIDAGQESPG